MLLRLPTLLERPSAWMEKQQNTILSGAMVLMVANVISFLSGFIRQRVLIATYLDGNPASERALNALFISFQIPDTMFQLLILGALSAAFIPIFSTYKKQNDQEAFKMSSIMMNVLLAAFALLSIFIFFLAEPITRFRTGPSFTTDEVIIVTTLTRIMLLSQFFFAISNFMTGILQSYQRFIISSMAPILYNLGILIGVFAFSGYIGIYAAGVGAVIGAFLHMIVQVPSAFKLGYRYHLSFNLRHPGVLEFFKLMPPRMLSIGANEIRKLFLGFFTTSIVGTFSFGIFQLALTLMTAPIRFFGIPISQASLPFLSDKSDEKDRTLFRKLVLQSLHQIAFFSLPASVLLLILRVPIVRLAYGTNNFSWSNTILTGKVVAILAISVAAQAMGQLLVRSFYALKDTRTPLLVAINDVILYLLICGALVFGTNLGIVGIAVATSATAIVEFLLLLIMLDRKVQGFNQRAFWIPFIKMIVTSFLMAVFLYLPFRILDEVVFNTSKTLELIGLTITTSTIGMLVYIFFAALFDIRELALVTNLLYTFDLWRKPLERTSEVVLETNLENEEV